MVNLSSRMALTLKAAFPARLIHLRLLVMLALGCCVLSAGVTAFSQEKKVALPSAPPRPGKQEGPTRIGFAFWLGDVKSIDSVGQTLEGNALLVLRWNDPSLAHPGPDAKQYAVDDIWHPRFLISNVSEEIFRSLPEVIDVAPDGTATYRQHLVGRFSQALNLRDFPFDHETFRIQIVVPGYTAQDILFEPDPGALAAGLKEGVGVTDRLTLQDWRITRVGSRVEPFKAGPNLHLTAFALEIDATRQTHHFILKVIIPLILIVMMSWAVFWIEPTDAGSQLGVAVTAMLTLIAYRFAIDGDVPKLPYLTRLDSFVLMSTVLVFLSIIEVLITSKLANRDRLHLARLLDRQSRWGFPVAFTLGTLFTLVI